MRIRNDVRVLRDKNLSTRSDASPFKHLKLSEKLIGIEHATTADDRGDAEKDPCRNVMGDKLLTFMENCVACVAAPVVPEDVRIGVRTGEIVSDFSFAAISILEIHYHINRNCHGCLMISSGSRRSKYAA